MTTTTTTQDYINTILGKNGKQAREEIYKTLDEESQKMVDDVDEEQVKAARGLFATAVMYGAQKGISPMAQIIGARHSLASLETSLHKVLTTDKEVLMSEAAKMLEEMAAHGVDVPEELLKQVRDIDNEVSYTQKIKQANSEEDILNILKGINKGNSSLQ